MQLKFTSVKFFSLVKNCIKFIVKMIEMNCENVADTLDNPKSSKSYCCSRLSRRYLIAVLGYFGFLHVYLLRVNMSFAIVAMTSNNSRVDSNGTTNYVYNII